MRRLLEYRGETSAMTVVDSRSYLDGRRVAKEIGSIVVASETTR